MQETIVFSKGFSYHAANMLGEGRISPEEVEALAPRIRQAAAGVEKIRKEGWAKNHLSKDGNPEPVFFPRLPYPGSDSPNTPELLRKLADWGAKARAEEDAVVFCGVGGSYLGGKVLYDCCTSGAQNLNHHIDARNEQFSVTVNEKNVRKIISDGNIRIREFLKTDLGHYAIEALASQADPSQYTDMAAIQDAIDAIGLYLER